MEWEVIEIGFADIQPNYSFIAVNHVALFDKESRVCRKQEKQQAKEWLRFVDQRTNRPGIA